MSETPPSKDQIDTDSVVRSALHINNVTYQTLENSQFGASLNETAAEVSPVYDAVLKAFKAGYITFEETHQFFKQDHAITQERGKFDSLSDSYRGEAIRELLSKALERMQPTQALKVTMYDLAYFKSINDKYGQEEGDRIIRLAAKRLQEITNDAIGGRLGGDEYLYFELISHEEEHEEQNLHGADNPPDVLGDIVMPDGAIAVHIHKGIAYASPGEKVQDVITRASEKLKKDKDAFYEEHKELDRRK